MALNGLSSADHVEIGQTLKLPSNAVLAQAKPKPAPKPVPIQAKPNAISHTVARGQTLSQIARAYDIPITSLISINAIENPNQVNTGTKLMLRSTESSAKDAPIAVWPRPLPTSRWGVRTSPNSNHKPSPSRSLKLPNPRLSNRL